MELVVLQAPLQDQDIRYIYLLHQALLLLQQVKEMLNIELLLVAVAVVKDVRVVQDMKQVVVEQVDTELEL
tara:strand:- start:492 stop:704 length:213 start_codon:yes stop_codon:yes gene_type:complete